MIPKHPLISVVIPVLNGATNIKRTINSVIRQTHPYKELIIIDGGSTDGTVDILRSNNADIDYWTSGPDGSVYKAFNKGLHRATGDWIVFLGADDYLWDEDVLSKMSPHLTTAHPRHLIVYGRTAKVMPDGRTAKIMGAPWAEFSDKLADMALGHQGIFHHRDLFQSFGNFNEFFDIAGDYEFLLRYLKKSEPIYVPDIVVAAWEIGGISTNPKNKLKLVFERRHAMELTDLTPNWMSRVERLFYGTYINKISVLGEFMTTVYLLIARTIIAFDRKLRHY